MKILRSVALVAVLLVASASALAAPMVCAERTEALEALSKDYGEVPVAFGLTAKGEVMEILASPNGDSWTLLLTLPDGKSCLVTGGTVWQLVPKLTKLGPPV